MSPGLPAVLHAAPSWLPPFVQVGVFVSLVSTKIPFKGAGKEYIGARAGSSQSALLVRVLASEFWAERQPTLRAAVQNLQHSSRVHISQSISGNSTGKSIPAE